MAFEVVKTMQADRHLEQLNADDGADRRNGCYRRHLLTEPGDIELQLPRTRRHSHRWPDQPRAGIV